MGLATYSGLDAYMKGDGKVNGLSVGGSKKSMKSFATVLRTSGTTSMMMETGIWISRKP